MLDEVRDVALNRELRDFTSRQAARRKGEP